MRLAVTVVTLLAVRALAGEEFAPPPEPPVATPRVATPTWSLGAGLSFFSPVSSAGLLAGSSLGLLGTVTTIPITPSVSVERVFSPQFALGLGFEGSVQSVVTAVQPSTAAPTTSSGTIGLGLSPRFVMTNADAPVSFTLFSTLFAGYSSSGPSAGVSNFQVSSHALAVGVGGGIAFELRLLERLAVRVQANLARLSLSSVTVRTTGGVAASEANQLLVGASFIPSPSIELRLYL